METIHAALSVLATGSGDVKAADQTLQAALMTTHGVEMLLHAGGSGGEGVRSVAGACLKRAAMRRPGLIGIQATSLQQNVAGVVLACWVLAVPGEILTRIASLQGVDIIKNVLVEVPGVCQDPCYRVTTGVRREIVNIIVSEVYLETAIPMLKGEWGVLAEYAEMLGENRVRSKWFGLQLPILLNESLHDQGNPFSAAGVGLVSIPDVPVIIKHPGVGKIVLAVVVKKYLPELVESEDEGLVKCGEEVLLRMVALQQKHEDLTAIEATTNALADSICECFAAKSFLEEALPAILRYLAVSWEALQHQFEDSDTISALDSIQMSILDLAKMLGAPVVLSKLLTTNPPRPALLSLCAMFLSRREKWPTPLPDDIQKILVTSRDAILCSESDSIYGLRCVSSMAAACVAENYAGWVDFLMQKSQRNSGNINYEVISAVLRLIAVGCRPLRVEENPEYPVTSKNTIETIIEIIKNSEVEEAVFDRVARCGWEAGVPFESFKKNQILGLKYLSVSRDETLLRTHADWVSSCDGDEVVYNEIARVAAWGLPGWWEPRVMALVERGFRMLNVECAGCLLSLQRASKEGFSTLPLALEILPSFEGEDLPLSICVELLSGLDTTPAHPLFHRILTHPFYYPKTVSAILTHVFPSPLHPLALLSLGSQQETTPPPTLLRIAIGNYLGKIPPSALTVEGLLEAGQVEAGDIFQCRWREFSRLMLEVPVNRGLAVMAVLDS